MTYPTLPPEVNSARMQTGAGSAPMHGAASAWTGLAGELQSAASSINSMTSNLVGQAWQGQAASAMQSAAAPYTAWLSTAAGHTQQAASQASAVAAAYEAAHSATVPTPAVHANRGLLRALAATNILGINTPAIAATEGQYEEMWAQDVAAMHGYHAGASAAYSSLAPLSPLSAPTPHPVSS